ncbi:GNAT family N-acetyltransferase [Yersinia nurmii]|nr:GNAT family N-acetyltransferase [Yersinia nurmii]MDN0086118.1 GNAT family N-acetyltransferase [Yersinia nurmii]
MNNTGSFNHRETDMIDIRDVEAENFFDVCELTSNSNGIGTLLEEFVCCNAISLAESKFFPECEPKALYFNETLIGFFMYKQIPGEYTEVELFRYMLDYKFIGKGLGRSSFEAMLSLFRNNGVTKVTLMIEESNLVARKLYLSCGFSFTGKIEKGEHYYSLSLNND